MEEIVFSLEGHEFIPLDQLLKLLRVVESGGQAHDVISQGMVMRDGEVETRKRAKLRAGDSITFMNYHITITE
ncbi:MAG: RNA-binding S4 domain-containing protein [Flavobacteriales bacterium]|jgi:ribosome-associated protein|nr:RNA-binding S4 domain-containing protein [Flavobacteriales bacterium]